MSYFTAGLLPKQHGMIRFCHHTMADIRETLKERGSRYGRFDRHAETTQLLKQVIKDCRPCPEWVDGEWKHFFAPDQQEALDMICHKIGRIVCGDPNYADSWHDIAGYAQLVADRLNKEGEYAEDQ